MDLSLYVHIPFCLKKCDYCSFYSLGQGERNEAFKAPFVERILEEARIGLAKWNPSLVPSVYLGGGTPSSLPEELWRRLLLGLSRILTDYPGGKEGREWTVEANPESLTEEKLLIARGAGVNRISLGIQSFNQDTLMTLGRSPPVEESHRALELLKNQWPGEWNCDLICEVPGQTREDALNDWRILKAYGPPHLSLYTLSIEENTPLRRRIDEGEISEKIDEEIWFLFKSRLAIDGYRQYEVSNHHREGGAVCLHNIRYWRMRPYLGLGPGAVSTLRAKDRIVRLENPPQLARYLSLPPGTAFLQETLSSRILLSELLIMGLRVNEGLSMAEINRIYGVPLEAILPKWFAHGISEGLLQVEEDRLRTAGRGTLFLNSLLSSALEELDSPGVFLTDSPNWP